MERVSSDALSVTAKAVTAIHFGMTATGNHGYFDSLRVAPPQRGNQESDKLEFGGLSTHAVILSERSESKDLSTWDSG